MRRDLVHTEPSGTGMLRALIERVERATGPDREIDARVHQQAFCPWLDEGDFAFAARKDNGLTTDDLPAYTASLDAVVALIERELPGWDWGTETTICGGENRYGGYVAQRMRIGPEAYGKTPSLALLLAFLRAKESYNER